MPLWVDNPLAVGAQPTIHVTCQPHGTEIVSTGFRGSRSALLVMLLQVSTAGDESPQLVAGILLAGPATIGRLTDGPLLDAGRDTDVAASKRPDGYRGV